LPADGDPLRNTMRLLCMSAQGSGWGIGMSEVFKAGLMGEWLNWMRRSGRSIGTGMSRMIG
jgi:hypothetical protein